MADTERLAQKASRVNHGSKAPVDETPENPVQYSIPESTVRKRLVFLAGGTGYTGQRIFERPGNLEFVLLLRPDSNSPVPSLPAVLKAVTLSAHDSTTLADAMAGCDAVLSLIGTTRARFNTHGDYETVDYGTTVALVAAARKANIKHFVLLSAIGAGHPVGAYLHWKHRAEQVVATSGLAYTIVRPSFITGLGRSGFGLFVYDALMHVARRLGLADLANDLRSISVEKLATVFVRLLEDGQPVNATLTGRDLHRLVANL